MLFPMINVMYFYISTFQSMSALHNMAVICSFFMSCSPGVFVRYFLNEFQIMQLPLLLLVSFLLLHSTCTVLLLLIIIIIINYFWKICNTTKQ
jgi:hypothetical protein